MGGDGRRRHRLGGVLADRAPGRAAGDCGRGGAGLRSRLERVPVRAAADRRYDGDDPGGTHQPAIADDGAGRRALGRDRAQHPAGADRSCLVAPAPHSRSRLRSHQVTAAVAQQAPKKKVRPRNRWRATGWAFATPGLSLILLVLGTPLVYGVLLSLSSFTLLNPSLEPFVGTENFEGLLVDPYFWHSLRISVQYGAATVIGAFVLGLIVAVLLARVTRLKAVYFAVLAVPVA